jgi:pimeloyl-ACP methyl ester carboxylesterase
VTDLHHGEQGTGDPPALLIHGTGPAIWGELPGRLAEHRRTIVYDRRGYGDSPGPTGTNAYAHAQDAAALLEELGAAPAIVVGWSWGGIVALALAERRPELVAGLVLLEAPLHLKSRPNLAQLRAIGGAILLDRRGREHDAVERFARWAIAGTGGGWDSLPPEQRELMRANARPALDELRVGTGEELKPKRLATIEARGIWLVGDRSQPDFARAARRRAGLLRHFTVRTVTGAGHGIQLDRPDAVAAAVAELAQ